MRLSSHFRLSSHPVLTKFQNSLSDRVPQLVELELSRRSSESESTGFQGHRNPQPREPVGSAMRPGVRVSRRREDGPRDRRTVMYSGIALQSGRTP